MNYKRLFKLLALITLATALSFLLTFCPLHFLDGNRASQMTAQSFLLLERSELQTLDSYICSFDSGGTVYLDDASFILLKSAENRTPDIEEREILAAIASLKSMGAESFHSDENGYHIVIWTNLSDFGAGIVYSRDGSEETAKRQIQFLTKLTRLNESGFFYYESDYNKYRKEH